jgi:hypothetical protein
MTGLISLFSCLLISIISIFGTKMGLFGMLIFVPFLFVIPGYLLIELTRYEIDSKLKKLVIYLAISMTLTIIISFAVSKILGIVDYNIIILVISIFTIILELILSIQLIFKKNVITEIKEAVNNFSKELKKILSKINKSILIKSLIVILVLTGICFPLFIRRDADVYYSFGFTEDPPKTAYKSNVTFDIIINSLSDSNTKIIVNVLINESLFLEDEIYTETVTERVVQYQANFTENGWYIVSFEFYLEEETETIQIGYLLHWVRIIT